MSFFEFHAKYLKDGFVYDDEFRKTIVDEHMDGDNWIIRRSYSASGHTIEEHFSIQEVDQYDIVHLICYLKLIVQSHDAPVVDSREKIFVPRLWRGPDLYVPSLYDRGIY